MGFTVAWGGKPNKVINAMIFLPEGGFIELFTMEIGAIPRAVMSSLPDGIVRLILRSRREISGKLKYV